MATFLGSSEMKMRWMILVGLGLGIFSHVAGAADWPQWRGPERNGISQETGLLEEWPADGPKLLWQVKEIGSGYSTPAIVGNRIYLVSNEGLENEFVQALDVADGSQIWSKRIGNVGSVEQRPSYPAARSTPTVDGELLYAMSSDGDLVCLVTATGEIRWQKNVRTEFGGQPGEWAYAESPLVDGDLVVCTPGGSDGTIVALDMTTGDVVWKCAVPGGDEAGYASAIVVETDGIKQYVQVLGKGLVGVNALSGEFLWRYDEIAKDSPANIFTPVAHEGLVYTASNDAGGGVVKIAVDGGVPAASLVYVSQKLPKSIGGAVRVGDYLYGTSDVLQCIEFATGEIKWEDRSIGTSSVCFADGRLYLHGENGDVALVAATPDGYQELGRFTPSDAPDRGRSKAWVYPVVADGRLYIHDAGSLWCYDVRNP